MPAQVYDVIVLGIGGIGSATLDHLARRGVRVLGLDRFPVGHDRGSSHGRTRLIRQAYYEHPSYVPLLKRAYELWADLGERSGKTLYHEVGVLQVGRADGGVIPGVLASAKLHGLAVEPLSRQEVHRRFPGFRVPEMLEAVFERTAGYLDVDDCVQAAAAQAMKHGAVLQTGEAVRTWRSDKEGVLVETDRQRYHAARLIIAVGAWAGSLVSDLGISFPVLRKSFCWYDAPPELYSAAAGAPGFIYECSLGNFYGFPAIDNYGLKVGEHTGGIPVDDPLIVDRSPQFDEVKRMESFLKEHLPSVTGRRLDFQTCLYTLSPDRQFVVDRHPRYPQVSFAVGLSGHGFKFVGVLGEILADFALCGRTPYDVGFLSWGRFS